MADSYVQYTVPSGGQSIFTVPFPYLSVSDVQVSVNGIPQLSPWPYQWITAGSIQFTQALAADSVVLIQRQTSPDSLEVMFNNGAVLTASDLNTAALQTFYRTQEIQDELNEWINGGITVFGNGVVTGDMSPQDLIDSVSAYILSTNLANTLQQSITDINTNAQSIAGNTAYIDSLQTYQTVGILSVLNLLGTVTNDGSALVLNTTTTQVANGTTLAEQIDQLQTSINGNTSSIQTAQDSINGLNAQYTVKVDVNGHVAGFGLADTANNDGTVTSTFIINADAFAIIDTSNGSTGPTVPFTVRGGITYIENVVINGALIESGSITNAEIANGTITNAQIADGTITNANIANGTITNAEIADATITGTLIVDGSIVQANMAQGATSTTNVFSAYNAAGTGGLEVAQNSSSTLFTTTFTGAYTTIIEARVNFYAGTSAMDCQADLEIDGVVVDSGYFKVYGSGSTPYQTSVSLFGSISDPGEGSHTVTVVARNNTTSGYNFWYSMPFLSVLRLLN